MKNASLTVLGLAIVFAASLHAQDPEGLKNVVAVKAGADCTNVPEPIDVVLIVDT